MLTAGSWRNTAAAAAAKGTRKNRSRRELALANVPAPTAPIDYTDAYVQARNEAKGTQVWFSGDGSTTDLDAGTCITKASHSTLYYMYVCIYMYVYVYVVLLSTLLYCTAAWSEC